MVASQGKTSLELSEGSLGEAEVVGEIVIWGDAWDQPRRNSLPGLSAPPPQSSSQMFSLQRVKGARLSALRP